MKAVFHFSAFLPGMSSDPQMISIDVSDVVAVYHGAKDEVRNNIHEHPRLITTSKEYEINFEDLENFLLFNREWKPCV